MSTLSSFIFFYSFFAKILDISYKTSHTHGGFWVWVPTHGGAGGGTPRAAPEGFLFVATKRNPSDSKEKNALVL